MGDFCSEKCNRFDKCKKQGITLYMKVLPVHPSELNKNWCGSFEETEDNKECEG